MIHASIHHAKFVDAHDKRLQWICVPCMNDFIMLPRCAHRRCAAVTFVADIWLVVPQKTASYLSLFIISLARHVQGR